MKREILLTLVFLSVSGIVHAQIITFEKYYGTMETENCNSLVQAYDGGYVLTGYMYDIYGDIYTIKLDANGDTVWSNRYWHIGKGKPSTKDDAGYSVIVCKEGGYAVAGVHQTDIDSYYPCLLTFDSDGDTIKTKTYSLPGDAYSAQQTADSGFILAGYKDPGDAIFIKTNKNLDTVWTKVYGGTNIDCMKSIIQTYDGQYLSCGYTYSFGAGMRDIWLLKLKANGDTAWSKTIGSASNDESYSICQMPDSGSALAGYSGNYSRVVKMDKAGTIVWDSLYGNGEAVEKATTIYALADGGLVVAGKINSYAYISKLSPQGGTSWRHEYYLGNIGGIASVQQTIDGGFVLSGTVNNDYYVLKTDSLGMRSGKILSLTQYGNDSLASYGPYPVKATVYQAASLDSVVLICAIGGVNDTLKMNYLAPDTFIAEIPEQTVRVGRSVTISYYAVCIDSTGSISKTPTCTFAAVNPDTVLPEVSFVDSLPDDSIAAYGPYSVKAQFTDNDTVFIAYLYWRYNGGYWNSTSMYPVAKSITDTVAGQIEEFIMAAGDSAKVEYYVRGTDYSWNTVSSAVHEFKLYGPLGVSGSPETQLPRVFALLGWAPNPARQKTTISFQLPQSSEVKLAVYDVTGRLVEILKKGWCQPGVHKVEWNVKNASAGVYFCRLIAGNNQLTKRLVVVK